MGSCQVRTISLHHLELSQTINLMFALAEFMAADHLPTRLIANNRIIRLNGDLVKMYKSILVVGEWGETTRQETRSEGGGAFRKAKQVTSEVSVKENCFVDFEDFTKKIEDACNDVASGGYEVVSILPIQRGNWQVDNHYYGNAGRFPASGAGYSPTVAAIITARKAR